MRNLFYLCFIWCLCSCDVAEQERQFRNATDNEFTYVKEFKYKEHEYTNDGLCVQMSRCIIDKHNCFIDINGTCIGTTPDVVANNVLKEINRKISDLQRYKEKIENNMNIDYGVTHWAVIK